MTDPRFFTPAPPPPRALTPTGEEITRAFGSVRRWAGVFLLGHGGIMTLVFGWGLPIDVAIELDGARVDATVTDVSLSTSTKINKRRATRVTYSYTSGGEVFVESFHTIEARYVRLKPGAKLPIELWPTLPSWSRPLGKSNAFFGYLGALLALEPLIGGPVLLSGLLLRRQARAAWLHGVAVPGTVLSKVEGRVRKRRGSTRTVSTIITWSYGWQHQALTSSIDTDSALLKSLEAGQAVTMLVHPSRPTVAVPWVG